MKPEMIAAIAAAATLLVLICLSAIRRRRRMREFRTLIEYSQMQIDELREMVVRVRETSESIGDRATDHGRRIAWLETRIRKPRASADEVLDDSILTETPKLSMTERRHRVITLASRGKSIDAIASTLGLFSGEVELILSLNQAAAAAR